MYEREVVVKSDAGVHARPAMMLVKEAMKHPGKVSLIKGTHSADCKSIMSVLGLVILSGTKLTIRAEGEKAGEIVDTLAAMIESDFKME